MPPTELIGNIFKLVAPSCCPRTISEGVNVPGVNGKPNRTASLRTASSKFGATPKDAPIDCKL